MIVLNPFLDSLCNFGFRNIGPTPGIPKACFQHPQDIVTAEPTKLAWTILLLNFSFIQVNKSFCLNVISKKGNQFQNDSQ